jgi:short-subunit dehydrogenase
MDRALILGASRGLGAELVRAACGATYPVIGFGRKEAPLKALRENFPLFDYVSADFSTESGQNTVLAHIKDVPFSKLIYVAGGGPYGDFGGKKWAAHEWAWEVTFKFPARLLHFLSEAHRFEQVVLVGSSVAEASADKSAASYAAAKHALKGLWSSLRLDYPDWDLRLFSPGYMNTELLPANAPVREKGVYSPRDVAEELWTWSLSADNGGHRVYPKHPV